MDRQADNRSSENLDSQILMALSDWDLNSEIESDLADSIQSAFESMEQSQLIYRGSLLKQNLEYFSRRVAKDPSDLTSHVKRFYLAMLLRSEKDVLGALVDLIIMLRFKGGVLIERLIHEAEAILNTDIRKELLGVLENKSANKVLGLDTSKSVLINGCCLPAVYKKRGKN